MNPNNFYSMIYEVFKRDDIQKALNIIEEMDDETLSDQLFLTEIPAGPFNEKRRGEALLKIFQDMKLSDVHMSNEGNVIGIKKTNNSSDNTIISAHMDTVFSEETEIKVKVKDDKYYAPGIFDNSRGLAELITIIKVIQILDIKPLSNIIFVATVGEEGIGNLRGARELIENTQNIRCFISIDGMKKENLVYGATFSKRLKVKISTIGGHSFIDYGKPSATHALGRAINKISDYVPPSEGNSTYTVGVISGGTSINAIASEAEMLLDLRSNSERDIIKMEKDIHEFINEAIEDEKNRWNKNEIDLDLITLGERPGGLQKNDSPIVSISNSVNEMFNIKTNFINEGSTDSNIAIHKGIPAITLGRGGTGGGTHTVKEWFNPKNGYIAIQRTFLNLLVLAGHEDVIEKINLT